MAADQTSMTWRPLYVPHTVQAAWGNLGERHWGHATVATGTVFHWARRERVLLRDILRLGTAMAVTPRSSVSVGSAPPSVGRPARDRGQRAARPSAPRTRGTGPGNLDGTAGWSAARAPPRPAALAPGRSGRPVAGEPHPRRSSRPWCCARRHTAPGSRRPACRRSGAGTARTLPRPDR